MGKSSAVWAEQAHAITTVPLCDLMSRKGLAYLFLALDRRKVQGSNGAGRAFENGRSCARRGRFRARPSGLGRADRAGAGVRRIACLYFAADSGLGRAGRDWRVDRRQRHQLLAGLAGRRDRCCARRLGLLLVRLQVQGTRRADVAAVAISGHPAARRGLREKWGVPSIFIGRFFGPLRASVPLAAGIFEMPYWRFQIANFVSALVWSAALLLFGDVIAKIAEWLWRTA